MLSNCDCGLGFQWDLCDDTLQTLLDKMAFEDQIPLRKAYINSLSLVLSAMGPATIRWSKPLLLIFDEYLTKESYDTRKSALEVNSLIHL